MSMLTSALIVDDDPDASEYLRYRLARRLDGIVIEVRHQPDVSGQFNLYFIDNDFDGCRLAAKLVRQIRTRQPGSLIFAFSAHLDADTLKQLINAGCDGVCEKHRQDELERFLDIVQSSVSKHHSSGRGKPDDSGLCGTIRSITELIREWNRRLESNGSQR
jgi:DNA-binding NtrC family response regulator